MTWFDRAGCGDDAPPSCYVRRQPDWPLLLEGADLPARVRPGDVDGWLYNLDTDAFLMFEWKYDPSSGSRGLSEGQARPLKRMSDRPRVGVLVIYGHPPATVHAGTIAYGGRVWGAAVPMTQPDLAAVVRLWWRCGNLEDAWMDVMEEVTVL